MMTDTARRDTRLTVPKKNAMPTVSIVEVIVEGRAATNLAAN